MNLAVCYTNESHQPKVSVLPVLTAPALQAELRSYKSAHPDFQGKVHYCALPMSCEGGGEIFLLPPSLKYHFFSPQQ